jgi:hypothetical protein
MTSFIVYLMSSGDNLVGAPQFPVDLTPLRQLRYKWTLKSYSLTGCNGTPVATWFNWLSEPIVIISGKDGQAPGSFVAPGVDVVAATMDLPMGRTDVTPSTSSISIRSGGFTSMILYFTIERV